MDKVVTIILKGGPGSGFHGHRGRPGLEGGSLPRGDSPYYAEGLLEYQGYHQDNLRKLIKRSYFTEDKERLVNSRLRTSLQDQYVVLGFDPLEMIRRGRNRVYLLDELDYRKELEHWLHLKPEEPSNVVGFVSNNGSVYLDCGRYTTKYPKGSYGAENGMLDFETVSTDVITHEFGHVLWNEILDRSYWIDENSPKYPHSAYEATKEWRTAYDNKEVGRLTEYSNKNEREGFAEAYMTYVASVGTLGERAMSDPAFSKTFEQIKKFIDIARSKYAK